MYPDSIHQRGIDKVWDVIPQAGRGPHLQVAQVLRPSDPGEYDPFLFLAEDWFRQGTFDFHPHRGMETVTYVLEGRLKHEDNHGGQGVLEPGDVQWMTAGKGIIHSEDPLPGETVHSLQLWINLPGDKKRVEPSYQDLHAAEVPEVEQEGTKVRVFSGKLGSAEGPARNQWPVTFLELRLKAGAQTELALPGRYSGFLYILEGSGRFGAAGVQGRANQGLRLAPSEAADSLLAVRADAPLRALLYAGAPIGEPIAARGPFVMNTEEEIREAYADFFAGKFGPRPG